ncbi:MAG: glutamyl-tRNA reductase [Anaerolineales bacterium]
MHIHCVGLNHATAGLNLREKLAFSADEVQAALARLGCGAGFDGIQEMAILSTCNRVELYAVVNHDDPETLLAFLAETRGVTMNDLRAHTYHWLDTEAVRHLFRVAAGLDSLVIGEPQILGQVTRALELARGQNAAGPLLNRLFQAAIHAGKHARTDTTISRNPASVATLAATLAERTVHDVRAAQIVVLGAGEMAELAVEALRKRGAARLLVVNRTLQRARLLAERWGAEIATFERLEEALQRADILISSTGAPHTLIQAEAVAEIMPRRSDRPLVMIDIAVPRDIDPTAAGVPGVRLYDMDSLDRQLQDALEERQREVPQVEAILEEELAAFDGYLRSLEMLPLINELGAWAESIRQAELEKTLRKMPELSAAERKRLEKMTQALVKKLFAPAIQRLRAEAGCVHAPDYATVTRTLFDLEEGGSMCSFSGKPCPVDADRRVILVPVAAD